VGVGVFREIVVSRQKYHILFLILTRNVLFFLYAGIFLGAGNVLTRKTYKKAQKGEKQQ
jgi:hypothetical protein